MNAAYRLETHAFILHASNYQESSLLLRLLTRDYGYLSAIAKGARRPRHNKKALLQPFQPLTVTLAGKSELKTLAAVETIGSEFTPMDFVNPDKYACGCYLNELLMRLMHAGEMLEGVYPAYQQALWQIAKDQEPAPGLRRFEWHLLIALGVAPDLSRDQASNPILAEAFYQLHAQARPLRLSGEQADSFPGQLLLDVQAGRFDITHQAMLRRLIHTYLKPLLGDKPLQSRKLWQHKR